MKQPVTYLNFNGNCKAAMEFYKGCFDAELFLMPFAAAPPGACGPGEATPERIMHATVTKGSPILMASDIPPGMPYQPGTNFAVSLECDSKDEQAKLFAALGQRGKVTMPLQDTFWGAHFGMLTDQFGIQWMLNYTLPKQG